MVSDLPSPLTPADCDLRAFAFMPLDVLRLRDSLMAAVPDAEAFRAAVLLWCASWHQVPAASLPNDEHAIARLAGYGRDLKTWRKAKDGGALRGWVTCSDGRLYHPVVAEKAHDALLRKVAQRERTDAARTAREAKRAQSHSAPIKNATTENVTTSVTDNATKPVTTSVTESNRQDRTGQGQDKEKQAARTPAMPTLADPPAAWMHLADKRESDDDGVEHPVVAGYYLDGIAAAVCNAARMDGRTKAVDWTPLIALLRDGYSPHEQIIPTIQRLAGRPGYTPPRFLSYFDQAIREMRAAA